MPHLESIPGIPAPARLAVVGLALVACSTSDTGPDADSGTPPRQWCTPSDDVPSGWSYLDNGVLRIGANLDHGAAIGHLSLGSDDNVLNAHDTGRYLQQSFYGMPLGGSWNGKPWPFNPVQGGSWDGDPSPVTGFCNDGTTLYAKTLPLDWGDTGPTPCVMEEWITLEDDVAVIRFRFEYNGDWLNMRRDQETPALFVRRDLEVLVSYQGNAPWTGDGLTRMLPNRLETQGNQYVTFTEPWLAYVDADDRGVGLYKRGEDYATCYRYGEPTSPGGTSYFAFIDELALVEGLVHDYTLYAMVGDLTELRSRFYAMDSAGR